jgi:probable phosphoglycerate mutase
MRDVDVPLSELGHQQAEGTGRWFAAAARDERPEVILSSPYIRAARPPRRSATPAALAGGAKPTIIDERLREREFGVFDG